MTIENRIKSIINFGGKVFSKVTALIFLILLSNAMSAPDLASFILCFSIINLGSVAIIAGLPKILTRAAAVDAECQEKRHVYKAIRLIFSVGYKRYLVVAVLGYMLLMSLDIGNLLATALIIFGTQFLQVVVKLRMAYLRGENRQILASFPEFFVKTPTTMLAFIVLSRVAEETDSLLISLFAVLIGSGICFLLVIGFSSYRKIINTFWNSTHAPLENSQPLLKEKALNQLAFFLLLQTDIWILQVLGDSEIGIYRISAQIGLFLLAFDEVFGAIFSPQIARALAQEQIENLNKVVTKCASTIFLASLVTIPCLLMIPNEMRYDGSVYNMNFNLLVVGIIASGVALSQLVGNPQLVIGLSAKNHGTIGITCFVIVSNVLLSLSLGIWFGLEGVALATALSFILLRYCFASKLSRDLKLSTGIFNRTERS